MAQDWLRRAVDDVVGCGCRPPGIVGAGRTSTQPGYMLTAHRLASLCVRYSQSQSLIFRSSTTVCHKYPLSALRNFNNRRMSSQSIAVIDDSELKDGEMCVSYCGPSVLISLTDLGEWQEGGFVWRWKGTAFASRRPSTCNECILYSLRSTPGQRSSDSGRKGGVVSLIIYLSGTLAY